MKTRITSRPIALIISLIFLFASAIIIWKMIEDGSTVPRMISALAFAIAGVLWTIIMIKAGSAKE